MRVLHRPVRHRLNSALQVFVIGALAFVSTFAMASTTNTSLDRFLIGLNTWRVHFIQRTTDSRGRSREVQKGQLLLQRPGRFRWEVSTNLDEVEPAQTMVSDGRNLWFFDRELDQVTVRPANTGLTATPAMLLAGAVPLRSAFTVTEMPNREGLNWVLIEPQRNNSEFKAAHFGFSGLELRRLEIFDKLGQKSVLLFSDIQRNINLAPEDFIFTPPDGVDVIGKPVG